MPKVPRYGLAHFEQRKIGRSKIFEPASIDHGGTALRVHILDLSAHGALVHAVNPPPVGSSVALRIADHRIWSKIVWVEVSYFGLSFLMPIQADLVDRICTPKPPRSST